MMWHFLSCASFKITISCKLPHQKRGKNCRFCLAILKHAKLSCQIIGHHGYRGWVTHTASSKNVETLLRKKRHFLLQIAASHRIVTGGVRHDPQRFMGKTVYEPHFNRDKVAFASRERDESKPGIKALLPFPKKSDLENFQDLILALNACYWLHKVISINLSRFGDDRKCDFSRF